MALTFGCGMILGHKLGDSKKENKNESKENKDVDDNQENKNNNVNNEIISIEIDDKIRELYFKYHGGEGNSSQLDSLHIETLIYDGELFEIKELKNNDISSSYSKIILNSALDNLKDVTPKNDEEADLLINKAIDDNFKIFFGKNLKRENNTLGCLGIQYDSDYNFFIESGCGDTSPIIAKYNLLKAEKDSNNIYLYEEVVIYDENDEIKNNYKYKWTYDLQEDGNYYFLKSERVSIN